ncbi:hypothetical protein [Demequina rhizosphaerae]|uniref:hypothetical protein n=1 Tax=Demequina rhizosphaerae TaxID=1638985 RepID=UPI0007848F2D|nr:hypothetical protein [Demequina rhizosphaerae]
MRWQEILDRFRPVTAPGGAAESAEHVAARTGVALELAPVFAALDGDLATAARRGAEARSRAERVLDEARRDAAARVARAHAEAPALEARAAATVRAEAESGDEAALRDARERTDALTAERSPRIDDAADAVVARLVEDLRGRP